MSEEHLFLVVNGFARRTPWLNGVAASYATYGVVLFAVLLGAAWWMARRGSDTVMAAALWAPVGVLLAIAINQPIVHALAEPRPYADLPNILVLVQRTTDPSSPSDHATMAAAVAAGLFLVRRSLGMVAAAAAVLMGLTRVYVGAHYPTDILFGFILGLTVVLTGFALLEPLLVGLVARLRGTRLRPLLAAGS